MQSCPGLPAACRAVQDMERAGAQLAQRVRQQPHALVTGATFEGLLHTQVGPCCLLARPCPQTPLGIQAMACVPQHHRALRRLWALRAPSGAALLVGGCCSAWLGIRSSPFYS